ncbi:hypothetical protein TSUD_190720 [Trifolium subterraneum]|uniref:Uncharacterized protein n=1 Tax=Trifolium subterraneum TaxID=3900 RepID=A0A2Z6PCR4_TRISU|nr:hypothetical protein TSUD_190720 [Trifolium subterraneum]
MRPQHDSVSLAHTTAYPNDACMTFPTSKPTIDARFLGERVYGSGLPFDSGFWRRDRINPTRFLGEWVYWSVEIELETILLVEMRKRLSSVTMLFSISWIDFASLVTMLLSVLWIDFASSCCCPGYYAVVLWSISWIDFASSCCCPVEYFFN